MGPKFPKRDKNSPLGFFEDMEFGENDDLRRAKDITKQEWEKSLKSLVRKRQGQVQENLEKRLFHRWGWKNPSATLFIRDYMRLLNPDVIWCVREKEANLQSLKKFYDDAEWIEKMYECKTNKMEAVKNKCYIIKLEDFIANTEYEVGKLVGHLNLNPNFEQLKRGLNHVLKTPDLRKPAEEEDYINYL